MKERQLKMLIDKFCQEMAARFPYALKTEESLKAYIEDAQFVLKNYQGEVLGFAFNIIREDWKKLPKVPEVKNICLKVNINDEKKPEDKTKGKTYAEMDNMIDQFMKSPRGLECIKRGIANQAEDFIWENIKLPNDRDCNHFLKVERETKELLISLRRSDGNGPLAGLGKGIAGIGEHFKVKEQKLKDKYSCGE